LPRLPVLIGVVGLGAVVTTGTWFKRRADSRTEIEFARVRTELATRQNEVAEFSGRYQHLRWLAARMDRPEEGIASDSERVWSRERARLFGGLLEQVDRTREVDQFSTTAKEIEAAAARGNLADARERLQQLPRIRFPESAEFRRLQEKNYFGPLAEFSRQNPEFYRAFQKQEPEAFAADYAELKKELDSIEAAAVTPQLMLRVELLTAVAPPDDPVVADWAVLANAADYFENPTPAVLGLWRQTQRAIRLNQWQTAVAHMQSIIRTTVRTRQPYRAAYGWALIKNSPDAAAEAYPLLAEAAAAGDRAARSWVVKDDFEKGRYGSALRWLEGAVAAGDLDGVPKLLELYGMSREAVPREPAREAEMLQRIIVAPDAPPLATQLLARKYESGGGVPASATKAFELYHRAAQSGYAPAFADLARCYRKGLGVTQNPDEARVWAVRAFSSGEVDAGLPLLIDLMDSTPDRTATAVQEMFEQIQTSAPAGFADKRVTGPGVAKLQLMVARYFDHAGDFSKAARLYGQVSGGDGAAAHRHTELVTAHPCETCGGVGKIKTFVPCPTCGGKGTVVCHVCDGRGYKLVPGTPPCTTCGGSGAVVQNGHTVSCSACGGTGKGKGSVIKENCTACSNGREPCRDCTGGQIPSMKECPDCHGTGARALADQ
jgi:TPR repeat protein